jgi:allophanate hydrolase subunit 2
LPADLPLPSPAQRIRVLAVPGNDDPRGSAREELVGRAWTVAGDSDRRGLRLTPAAGDLVGRRGSAREAADRPSEAVIPGTIQVTPSGQPLVLMPDGGTTGGYPVVAVVIDADRPILGQLAPWDEVRFRLVDLAAAQAAVRERRALLNAIADRLGAIG